MPYKITTILLCGFLMACTQQGREQFAKDVCESSSNCSITCPDGTVTDARFPKCPINDRDLLPPSRDNGLR